MTEPQSNVRWVLRGCSDAARPLPASAPAALRPHTEPVRFEPARLERASGPPCGTRSRPDDTEHTRRDPTSRWIEAELKDEQWGERMLGGSTPLSDPSWKATRGRFAAGAVREGLLDVAFETHETPLGRVLVGATRTGIVRLALPIEDADEVVQQLADTISVRVLRAETPVLTEARRELDEYFDGRRRAFEVPLDWQLSHAFRREVLRATAQIPYGATSSYARVATAAGSPRAVRAAGSALATNPIPILVPCHRVLRSDGAIGQYRGGAEAKALLLELERG